MPMLPPPPPTFRAPTRDMLVTKRRSSSDEVSADDVSFMDEEVRFLNTETRSCGLLAVFGYT